MMYFLKFIQKLISRVLITTCLFLKFQVSSFNSFWDISLTGFHLYFSKSHNSGKVHIPVEKKIGVSYSFMRNPCKKFQNSSMHGSTVMLCIKKRDERTGERPRSNMPLQLLWSWGHNKHDTRNNPWTIKEMLQQKNHIGTLRVKTTV